MQHLFIITIIYNWWSNEAKIDNIFWKFYFKINICRRDCYWFKEILIKMIYMKNMSANLGGSPVDQENVFDLDYLKKSYLHFWSFLLRLEKII